MPYVPSKKTDGNSTDRELIDRAVEIAATKAASRIQNNFSVIPVYSDVFLTVANRLTDLLVERNEFANINKPKLVDPGEPYGSEHLAHVIYNVGESYGYEGAFLGELNYALTRFIQLVPKKMVATGKWSQELRYWVYACTVQALVNLTTLFSTSLIGIGGVFEDVKDEYKRRVNTAYEAAQIVKSGDCYNTPYYTRLVEVVDKTGKHLGYQEVMLKRSIDTEFKDVVAKIVVEDVNTIRKS